MCKSSATRSAICLETTLTQLEDEMLQRNRYHDSVATPGPA